MTAIGSAEYESRDQAARATKLPGRADPYRGVTPYRRRYQQLKRQAEASHLPIWRIINEFMHPYSGKYLFGDKVREKILLGENIKNSVVGDAARTCASALHGGLTSPSKPWFEIVHPDSDMMEVQPVKEWMHAVQEIMRSVLAKSNFYSVMPPLYREAVFYSPAAALVDPDPFTGIRLRPLTIGEYFLGQGADLRVNTLARRLEMTAAQLREAFGENNPGFSGAVRDALRNGQLDDPTFTIIHMMQPYTMFGGKPHKIFNYESVYFLDKADDPEGQAILLWQGHRSKPFVAVRWDATADDVYGYSLGMLALADDRMLQTMEKDYIEAVEHVIKPALTGPTALESKIREGGVAPGDYIPYAESAGKPAISPVYQVAFDFNNTRQKILETENQIKNKFYNNLFLSILFNTKQMTATEVAQRLEEKAMVLGPVLERFQSELFDPILDRVFCILNYEYGVIPPPPDEIAGQNLKIDYIGTLAQSVKMMGLTNITNSLPIIVEALKIDPSAAIKLNVKEMIDYVATQSNWPPKLVRSDEECAEMEARAAQAQQQAAQMEQIQALAGAAKQASETSLANGSLLTGAEGGMEGMAGAL